MSQTTLLEVEALASQLSFDEQLTLLERLVQRVRMDAPNRAPIDLYGIWKGKFPDNLDLDTVLNEASTEWEKEWSRNGDFVG